MPDGAIVLTPDSDIASVVNGAPAGATFWFESGIYRLASITPKDNQTFVGAEGAVLNGSKLLTDFTQDGAGRWVAEGQTQEGLRVGTDQPDESSGQMRAGYPETLYIDNAPQTPVDSLDKVGEGTFFFDYDADRIYFGTDPTGRTVEAGTTAHAFSGSASGVTINDLTIEKYATPTQYGTIQGGQGWTIQDNEVRLNYGVGIDAMDNSKIIGNFVHDNGQMGMGGGGSNLLVEGNEIARNGFWSGIDVFWEGGGSKFTVTDGLIVRGNYSHDNHGFGLWTDIDNTNSLYENNVLTNNDGGGITHEISGSAVIRNNTFSGNGSHAQGDLTGAKGSGENWAWGSAIQLQNSKDVEVYGNHVDMTGAEGGNGITMIQQDRGSGAIGEYTTTNNSIHDNVIVSRDGNGLSGGAADYNEEGMLNGGNVFSNNTYYMDGGDHWWWGDFPSGDDWAAYISDTGQDAGSQLLDPASAPDTASWAVPAGGGATPAEPVTEPPATDPEAPVTGSDGSGDDPGAPSDSDGLGGDPDAPPADDEAAGGGPDAPAPDPEAPETGSGSSPVDAEAPPPAAEGSGYGPDIVGDAGANQISGTARGEDIYGAAGNDRLSGLGGDDEIFGGRGSDTLDGGEGVNYLIGDRDADTFVFNGGNATTWIEDFSQEGADRDVIQIAKDVFASFDEVMAAAHDEGSDVWISQGDSNLVINETHKADLTVDDFHFL